MKLYKVTGYIYCWYEERDVFDKVIKRVESEGLINTIVRTYSETYAGDLALSEFKKKNDWPNAKWIEGPTVELAPEDQQMRLVGAPTLPGLG